MSVSEPPRCAADRLRTRIDGPVARRVGALQALTLAVQVWSGTFFPLALAAALPPGRGLLAATAAGAATGVGWLALRARIPAEVPVREGEDVTVGPDDAHASADDGRFTMRDLPWLLVTWAAVLAYVLIGLLVVHWVLLVVVLGVVVAVDGASLGTFSLAVICGLAVSASVEFGVERPLMRRWEISY